MTAYLITGESGTGKSTVAAELRKRGYRAYDADQLLAYHADRATGKPITEKREHYAQCDWLWDEVRLRRLLATGTDMFLTGASDNQRMFYPLFAKIFVLTIDAATLAQRLQNRRPGDYGMHAEELQEALHTFEGFTQQIIEDGAVPIDSTQPLPTVVNQILTHLQAS